MYKKFIKRFLDFILAFFGIIFLSPVFLIIAIAIKLDSKGAVFFLQERVGRNKKLFKILKFRTMSIDTPKDIPTHLLQGANKYITRVGNILRKTSLDELPQIINILIGQMAVVGPRPALYNQDDLVSERDKYGANLLRPGLTGWAQINGRDELPIPVKAKLDGEYVEKMNFLFDVKIFFLTISTVFKSAGIKEGASVEAENNNEINNFEINNSAINNSEINNSENVEEDNVLASKEDSVEKETDDKN